MLFGYEGFLELLIYLLDAALGLVQAGIIFRVSPCRLTTAAIIQGLELKRLVSYAIDSSDGIIFQFRFAIEARSRTDNIVALRILI